MKHQMTKKLLTILAIMLITFQPSAMAESRNQTNKGYVVLGRNTSSSNRPRIPSAITVGCEYGDGYLAFSFPENVCTLTFFLRNEEEETIGFATSEYPEVEIPSLHGVYTIECVDDGNRTYVGILDFE